jgi:uncharacterized protein YciI
VVRQRGPAWDGARSLREQDAWDEHADFMDALARNGFVLLGGPLGGGATTLLVIDAGSEGAVRTTLEKDPWSVMGLLTLASIDTWTVLLEHAPPI